MSPTSSTQVYEVSDTITVLRNGGYVGTYATADLPRVQLVAKMIGKEYADLNQRFVNEEAAKTEKETLLSSRMPAARARSIPSRSTSTAGRCWGCPGLLGRAARKLCA